MSEDARVNEVFVDWLSGEFRRREVPHSVHSPPSEYTYRCIAKLQRTGDDASSANKQDEAVSAYSTALLLNPSNPNVLLMKWARMVLVDGSVHEALNAASKVCFLRYFRNGY